MHVEKMSRNKESTYLLQETRVYALLRSIAQKQRMIRQFNCHVKTRKLQDGDIVLRKIEATGKMVEKGKLGVNWDGPFKIICTIKPGTFEFFDMNGKKLQRP